MMLNPRYIVKYVVNRETKESETMIFDSSIKTTPDKFGNVEVDTTKPEGGAYSSLKEAQYTCHILNLNHQQGYSGSDICRIKEHHLGYPTSDHFLPEAVVETIEHYGYDVRQVGLGEWRITK